MFWANATIKVLPNSGILVENESGRLDVGPVGGNNSNNLCVLKVSESFECFNCLSLCHIHNYK